MEPTVTTADDPMTDVRLAQTGNRQAFNRLVQLHQDMIFGLCVYLLGNVNDGEDAAQDTFINAFRNLSIFRVEASFATWLTAIALRVCRNYQRSFWQKLFRRSWATGMPSDDPDSREMIEIIDSSPLPSQELEKKELRDQIKKAMALLPARYRELIVLRDIMQMRYDRIAAAMDIPEGSIKSGIARARLALQHELRGLIYGF